jgi:undecaprenyl-diphosphatase
VDWFRAIVLGAIQGLTEFLPISSSAHLIIAPWLFGWAPFGLEFDVALHIGTLSAVVVYFRRDLLALLRGFVEGFPELRRGQMPSNPMGRLSIVIVIASIPAGIVGLLASTAIDEFFHADPLTQTAILIVAFTLAAMAGLLWEADRRSAANPPDDDLRDVTLKSAMLVGLAQSCALIPGVSRSGVTITTALLAGMSRPLAARFSFVLGVPLIAGAGLLEMTDLIASGLSRDELQIFLLGMLSAGIVGYLAIAGLLRFLQRRSLAVFIIYRLALAAFLISLVVAGFQG